MRGATRISLAIVVAFALLVQGWGPVTADGAALLACVAAVAAVVGTGLAARLLRLPVAAGLGLQAAVLVGCAVATVWLPLGPAGVLRLREVLSEGILAIRTGSAPLAPDTGVTLALVVLVGGLALFTDLLAITLERPAYAVVTLLALFLVPALGLPGPVGFDQVVRFGVGVGLVLAAASPHLMDARRGVRAGGWGMVAGVVALALTATSFVGALVPVAPTPTFGQDQLQMTNPSLDLKRNLTQGSPVPVLSYTTDQVSGAYLKMATLTAFDVGGFALDAVRVSMGRIPATPGLTQPVARRVTRVQVQDFGSEWLPVPYAPTEIRAAGGWGYANETLDVMALNRADRKTATRGLSYEVSSVDVRPSDAQVGASASTALAGQSQYTNVPQQLPARIRTLARDVTAGAPTAGAMALALEAYLRSNRFSYSTAQIEGDSMRTLDDFLFGSRQGYCEQFAGAMVAMARVVGLPARVAVGFTPGTFVDGTWQVSSRDMHTWPEVWLDGWGWVAFEPTPSSGVPSATTDPPALEPDPNVPAEPTETVEPTLEPSGAPQPESPVLIPETPAGAGSLDASVLVGLGLVLLVTLAGLAAPAVVRSRRRAARLGEGQDPRLAALSAWDEVRDEATDLGREWPPGSPRYAAEELAGELTGSAAEDVRRLALAAEKALFDRPETYDGPGSWGPTVRTTEEALRASATRGTRMRATWWPRSLWRR